MPPFPPSLPIPLAAPQAAPSTAESALPPPVRERYWLHAVLLLATVFTTLVVGAQLERNFLERQPMFSLAQGFFPVQWLWQEPASLLLGIPFAFTLMAILLAHEMGHYIACRHYGVNASLPYFIPAPTVIGTMGAFIRIRSPIPSRAALFDIAVAGPIAGFILAVPALVLGMALSRIAPELAHATYLPLGCPLILYAIGAGLPHGAAVVRALWLQDFYLHPIAVAGWVGMFATALNLLPGCQLDGGHILYALSPRAHRALAKPLLLALVLMSPFLWLGWLLWAAALALFRGHPPAPRLAPFGRVRRLLAACTLLMFLLSFTPAPFPGTGVGLHQAASFLRSLLHYVAR